MIGGTSTWSIPDFASSPKQYAAKIICNIRQEERVVSEDELQVGVRLLWSTGFDFRGEQGESSPNTRKTGRKRDNRTSKLRGKTHRYPIACRVWGSTGRWVIFEGKKKHSERNSAVRPLIAGLGLCIATSALLEGVEQFSSWKSRLFLCLCCGLRCLSPTAVHVRVYFRSRLFDRGVRFPPRAGPRLCRLGWYIRLGVRLASLTGSVEVDCAITLWTPARTKRYGVDYPTGFFCCCVIFKLQHDFGLAEKSLLWEPTCFPTHATYPPCRLRWAWNLVQPCSRPVSAIKAQHAGQCLSNATTAGVQRSLSL